MRGNYRQIAVGSLLLAQEILHRLSHNGTSRQPQRQSEAYSGREGEEFHLLSEFAVVALLGLLHHYDILVQKGFLRE